MQRGKAGDLGEFEALIGRYVPRDLLVLEAGCGPAHLSAALYTRNYRVIGVDYEPHIVALANQQLPHLDIREGDILNIDLPEASVGCYLSVGVVEHFAEGPAQALREARRILHQHGVALISVPYLNPARRRFLSTLPSSFVHERDLHFHQYYFSGEDFISILSEAGLRVIDTFPYSVMAFLTREHPIVSQLWQSKFCANRIKRIFRKLFTESPHFIRYHYGHMQMFVCRPV